MTDIACVVCVLPVLSVLTVRDRHPRAGSTRYICHSNYTTTSLFPGVLHRLLLQHISLTKTFDISWESAINIHSKPTTISISHPLKNIPLELPLAALGSRSIQLADSHISYPYRHHEFDPPFSGIWTSLTN